MLRRLLFRLAGLKFEHAFSWERNRARTIAWGSAMMRRGGARERASFSFTNRQGDASMQDTLAHFLFPKGQSLIQKYVTRTFLPKTSASLSDGRIHAVPATPPGYSRIFSALDTMNPESLRDAISLSSIPEDDEPVRRLLWNYLVQTSEWASRQITRPHFYTDRKKTDDFVSCLVMMKEHGFRFSGGNLPCPAELIAHIDDIIPEHHPLMAEMFLHAVSTGERLHTPAVVVRNIPLHLGKNIRASMTPSDVVSYCTMTEDITLSGILHLHAGLKREWDDVQTAIRKAMTPDDKAMAFVAGLMTGSHGSFFVHRDMIPQLFDHETTRQEFKHTSDIVGNISEFSQKDMEKRAFSFLIGNRKHHFEDCDEIASWTETLSVPEIASMATFRSSSFCGIGFVRWAHDLLPTEQRKSFLTEIALYWGNMMKDDVGQDLEFAAEGLADVTDEEFNEIIRTRNITSLTSSGENDHIPVLSMLRDARERYLLLSKERQAPAGRTYRSL